MLPDSNEILSIAGVVPIHDALGTVLGGVNSSGALAFQNTYDPFGGFAASGSPPSGYGRVYGMAGIEYDPTGLYHAGARYYSPILQRFLSEDPVRGKANMYLYAGNNPVTGSDVSGMAGDCPSGNCGITGGQENIPNDPSGLFALFEEILSALGLGGGSNSAPNYARFQKAVAFGRFNATAGLQSYALVLAQTGPRAYVLQRSGTSIPRRPDFRTVGINYGSGIVAGSLDISVDRYNHMYVAPGIAVGPSLLPLSGSYSRGWLNQRSTPTPGETNNFLTGHSIDASGGFVVGGGLAWTPGFGTATHLGFFSPQAGVAYHCGFAIR